MSSDYNQLKATTGSLKLKGSKITKKKTKIKNDIKDQLKKSQSEIKESQSKTPAELAFEENQRKRREQHILQLASKSHKDRVDEFNKKLESLSEHHDIPKVGPG